MFYNQIYIELMSFIVVGVLLYATIFETDHHTKRKKYFTGMLVIYLTLVIVDILTWIDIDWHNKTFLLGVLFSITYIFSFLIMLSFAEYMYVYISEKIETVKWPFIALRIYSIILCVIATYTCATGKLFYIKDGLWYPGEFESAYYVLYVVSLLFILFVLILNAKKLGVHDFLASISFILLPLSSNIIATVTGRNLSAAFLAIDMLIIYIMLESDKEDELIYWSNYDELTGLYNRRAYEKDLLEIRKGNIPEDFIYLAADVNGLKQVNDNIGHDAGDELIIAAAKALKSVFNVCGKVYRIGGDEFASMFVANEEGIQKLKESLEEEVSRFEGKLVDNLSISIGFASYKEYKDTTIEELAKIADNRMYSDKALYYQRNGIDRRSQRDAYKALCELYTKILKINLTNDSLQIVDMNLNEKDKSLGYSEKISEWLKRFGETGNVHPDDLKQYLAKTDINYMKDFFSKGNECLNIIYRRKYGNQFKYTMMEIIPAKEYTEDNQVMYLFVKRVEE